MQRPNGSARLAEVKHVQPQTITAATPLPNGWVSFCSKPDPDNLPRWYATPPYNAGAIGLASTVEAATWVGLHAAVNAELRRYHELTGK